MCANTKMIVVVVALFTALGASLALNVFNETPSESASFNQFEPEILMLEPKIIKNLDGTNTLETVLELTAGKYPLEYQETIKINGEKSADVTDTLKPNMKISRDILKPMESGEYVVQHEYSANGKDNYGNPISFVKTEYYNIVVP